MSTSEFAWDYSHDPILAWNHEWFTMSFLIMLLSLKTRGVRRTQDLCKKGTRHIDDPPELYGQAFRYYFRNVQSCWPFWVCRTKAESLQRPIGFCATGQNMLEPITGTRPGAEQCEARVHQLLQEGFGACSIFGQWVSQPILQKFAYAALPWVHLCR
jgi:hypothetical protein